MRAKLNEEGLYLLKRFKRNPRIFDTKNYEVIHLGISWDSASGGDILADRGFVVVRNTGGYMMYMKDLDSIGTEEVEILEHIPETEDSWAYCKTEKGNICPEIIQIVN